MPFSKIRGPKGWPECNSCINREFDPFKCENCAAGGNYESEDDMDALTVHELLNMMREQDE